MINSLCYTVGWFWCVLLGIQGHPFIASIGALCLILFQLYWAKKKSTSLYIQDLLLAAFSIPLGILLEMIFIHSNLIHYNDSFLPPVWIIFLYPLFSLLINHSLKFLKNNQLGSFLFGFFGAPLSYVAGEALGGLQFSFPLLATWIILGTFWGLFLTLLIKIGNIVEKATLETLNDSQSTAPVKLLYDGECPLCKREICYLKKKNTHPSINFIDISSEDIPIDYETAMSEIHAIDGEGNLLVGIPAFAVIYARCKLLVTSTLLRINFIAWFLKPCYKLFAKYRLRITGRQ